MTRMQGFWTAAVCLVTLAAPVPGPPSGGPGVPDAQELSEDLRPLGFLVGAWTGAGELFGQPAVFEMSWAPGLDGRVMRLRFSNALGEPGSEQPILSSEAMYRPVGEGRWDGTWFDTRGKRLDLRGAASSEPASLRVEWSDPGVEEGVTVYTARTDGGVEVVDSVRAAEGMRFFGRATYRREAAGAASRIPIIRF